MYSLICTCYKLWGKLITVEIELCQVIEFTDFRW